MVFFPLVFSILLASVGLLPAGSLALELVAPAADASFVEGKIVVIGREAKPPSGRGTLQWEDGQATLNAWAGRFYATATLSPGPHKATIVFGEDKLSANWSVAPMVPSTLYSYHPKVLTEECRSCHDPEAPPPPAQDVGKICYGCHTRYSGRPAVHQPVAQGLCTACHDPHGSTYPALLRSRLTDLCQNCHNRPMTKDHEKLREDAPCTDCHDAHGSSRPHNLKRR